MEWFLNLLTNTSGVGHIVMLYAFVIAVGIALGRVKIGGKKNGIALGVTFVLFVGILMGHLYKSAGIASEEGLAAPSNVLTFIQDFGLILFVYCIGIVFRHPTFVHFQKLYSGSKHRSLGWMPSNKGVLIFCGIPQCWCPVLVSFQERVFFLYPHILQLPKGTIFFRDMLIFLRFFLSPFNKVFASLTALSLLRKISL